MKEVDIWEYFLEFDGNNDGKVCIAFMAPQPPLTNNDCKISNLEFYKALHSLSFTCSRQESRDLLAMIDVGKDQQIDREEFYR